MGQAKPEAQLLRFSAPLDRLLAVTAKEKSAVSLLETFLREDSRGDAFKLEGLFKFYKHDFPSAKIQRSTAKFLEDTLGACTDVQDWTKFANALSDASKEKKGILAYLKLEEAKVMSRAAANLEKVPDDKDWPKELRGQTFVGKDSVLSEMKRVVSDWKWESYDQDRERVLSKLKDNLKDIEETDYDFTVLEGDNGIHELRRNLREFLIQAQALRGLILLRQETCPLPAYLPLVHEPIAKDKYNILAASAEEKKPCYLSQCLFLGLSKATSDLAAEKDFGQGEEMLKRYFRAQGTSAAVAEEKALAVANEHPGFRDYRARAREIFRLILQRDLLKELRRELKACLN